MTAVQLGQQIWADIRLLPKSLATYLCVGLAGALALTTAEVLTKVDRKPDQAEPARNELRSPASTNPPAKSDPDDADSKLMVNRQDKDGTFVMAATDELKLWNSVKQSPKPDALAGYLTAYPHGQFKSEAVARIAAIQRARINPETFTEEASQLTEDQIGLDKGQRRDVQRRLNGLGFETKVTGVFNADTRNVITRWQAARGYPKSGYLNKLQHAALLTEIATVPLIADGDAKTSPPRRRIEAVKESGPAKYYGPAKSQGNVIGSTPPR